MPLPLLRKIKGTKTMSRLIPKRVFKFRPGSVTIQFKQEERVFLLNWAKTLKPKTEIEERAVKRFLIRIMGETIYYPLYPDKDCPICERTVSGIRYETHVIDCKRKQKTKKQTPAIDPVVWEMMGGR